MTKSINDYIYEAQLLGNVSSIPSIYRGTVTIANSASAGTHTFTESGWGRFVTVGVGEMDGTGTATFNIVDPAGGTVFSQARVEKGTSCHGSVVPFGTAFSLVVNADAAQTAAVPAIFAIHYSKNP